jgi:hypothetical protein
MSDFMTRCLYSVVAVIGVACLSLFILRPEWAAAAVVKLWDAPTEESELERAERFTQTLRREDEIVTDRIAAKERLVGELLARQRSLRDTAAEFQRLDRETNRGADYLLEPGAECFEGERYCRMVLQWARANSQSVAPTCTPQSLQRLEDEFEGYRSGRGPSGTLPVR